MSTVESIVHQHRKKCKFYTILFPTHLCHLFTFSLVVIVVCFFLVVVLASDLQ